MILACLVVLVLAFDLFLVIAEPVFDVFGRTVDFQRSKGRKRGNKVKSYKKEKEKKKNLTSLPSAP